MDLGRVVCQSRRVHCELCPISDGCQAKKWNDPTKTPFIPEKKKTKKIELDLIRFVCGKGEKIFAYKKPKGTWLSGQYELPTFVIKKSDVSINQYPFLNIKKRPEDFIKTVITKYKIKNYMREISEKELMAIGKYELLSESEAKKKLSSASLKIWKRIKKEGK